MPACDSCLQGGLWWATADAGQPGAVFRVLRALALVGTLVGLEGRVLLPAFGHYLGLHYPWNYITVSAALLGAGSLLLLHFQGPLPACNVALPPRAGCTLYPHAFVDLLYLQLAQMLEQISVGESIATQAVSVMNCQR